MPVVAGFAEDKNEFNIVFDYGVRLIWLPKEAGSVSVDLRNHICNLVPNNRRERVETQVLTLGNNSRMQRFDGVATKRLARATHVADDDAEASTRRQKANASFPNL